MSLCQKRQSHGGDGILVWSNISTCRSYRPTHYLKCTPHTTLKKSCNIFSCAILQQLEICSSWTITHAYRHKLVDNMLDDEGTEHGDWSSCSPDLNPAELLQYAYRCIAAHPSPPMVVQQVEQAFLYKNCVELTKICCII